MTQKLADRVKELEEKLEAMEQKELLKTYERCGGCFKKKPPKGFRTFSVGPCGLTDYFRNEHVCPECAPKYVGHYREL